MMQEFKFQISSEIWNPILLSDIKNVTINRRKSNTKCYALLMKWKEVGNSNPKKSCICRQFGQWSAFQILL